MDIYLYAHRHLRSIIVDLLKLYHFSGCYRVESEILPIFLAPSSGGYHLRPFADLNNTTRTMVFKYFVSEAQPNAKRA